MTAPPIAILHWNWGGLYANSGDFRILLNTYNSFLCCLQKTLLLEKAVPEFETLY